ncbi:uncharacterized protein LOC114787540 isoform X3 [Denticeps clupeoides]|uniref:uncharacterized protein LOC114787540 isoform X3 n=1 Tax=Denticeps clupeoides TaxID=299321 RepID=UPI0010A3CF2E|nr:uncharacterized protein LOC114787540 isoform X3 [Denticeps clupeoides]
MSSAILTKLFILLILAFIVCLPEFFNYRDGPGPGCVSAAGSEVQMCEGCDSPRRHSICRGRQNRTEWERYDAWFLCETQVDLRRLCSNDSFAGIDVWLLLINSSSKQNLTFHSLIKNSSLISSTAQDPGLFYCCESPPEPAASGGSRCLLHSPVANYSALQHTGRENGFCARKFVWLVLIFTVVLTVFIAILHQVLYKRKPMTEGTQKVPAPTSLHELHELKEMRILTGPAQAPPSRNSKETLLKPSLHTRALTPIHEVELAGKLQFEYKYISVHQCIILYELYIFNYSDVSGRSFTIAITVYSVLQCVFSIRGCRQSWTRLSRIRYLIMSNPRINS